MGGLRNAAMRLAAAALLAMVLTAGDVRRARGQDADDIEALNQQVGQLFRERKYSEATELAERTLATATDALGAEHPATLTSTASLAVIYHTQGRYDEAQPLYLRALDVRTRVLGAENPDTLRSINNLAFHYRARGRYEEAEELYQRALEARKRVLGAEHPDTLTTLNNLAFLHHSQGRYGEAEPLYQRVIAACERVLGEEHPDTLGTVNNLAFLYHAQGRYKEAERLYQRVLEANERILGAEHLNTLATANNLAFLYRAQGRYGKANPLFRRALTGFERVLGAEHHDTLTAVSNLAELYRVQERYGEAEQLFRRALKTFERMVGEEHPSMLLSVNKMAELYRDQGRYREAEALFRRAIETRERILGAEHPDTVRSVNNLAGNDFIQGNWSAAALGLRRSTAIIAQRWRHNADSVGRELAGKQPGELIRNNLVFWLLLKASWRETQEDPSSEPATPFHELFRSAQWALHSEAARSLAQMAARSAGGHLDLTVLVRERQDLVAEWQALDQRRVEFLGRSAEERHSEAETEIRDRLSAIDTRITEIDAELAQRFPDYAVFANPEPLPVADVQAQLAEEEALVLFLDTPELFGAEEETFIWVVTKTDAKWLRADIGTETLTQEVHALRCGLDAEEWAVPARQRRCARLLGLNAVPDEKAPLPFHLGKAHGLYQALFAPVEEIIAGKRLLIVPSGPLTSLPFHVLVTEKPREDLPSTFDGYRNIPWLGRHQAIAVLPAVSSLAALRREAPGKRANGRAYLAYGDPVLRGNGQCAKLKVPEPCPSTETISVATAGRATIGEGGGLRSARTEEVFAQGALVQTVLQKVRQQCPLPDTAHEIRCIASQFPEASRMIRLADDARETDLKARSESGELADYAIIHFATHGLLSGNVADITRRQGEPALILTPPDEPADDSDDGLLLASEVASLKLNADWVVLSACNTAAGEGVGSEALSGLARAFFYAGGRTLLVSHWPVYSDAAVRLTTHAFAELDRDGEAGRAEALQRAMVALMDDAGKEDNAHPAVWAPFVVVGEGGR